MSATTVCTPAVVDEDLQQALIAVELARDFTTTFAPHPGSVHRARSQARMAAVCASSCRALAVHWAGRGRKDIARHYLDAANWESRTVHLSHLIANRYTRHAHKETRP